MLVPAALLALPLLAGCVSGILTGETAPHWLIFVTAGASLIALVSSGGFFCGEESGGFVIALLISCCLAGYSLGGSAARALSLPPLLAWFLEVEPDDPVLLEGVLREDATVNEGAVTFVMNVTRVAAGTQPRVVSGGARLFIGGAPARERLAEWRAGRTLRVSATLRVPATFRNPGVPDERIALARRGVVLNGSVKSGALVDVVRRATLTEECAAAVRAWARQALDRHVGRHDPRSAAVATAILIGDRTGLSEEDERRLQDAGTYHVIAISGGNIAMLTAVLLGVAAVLRAPHRAAASCSIVVLLFYGEIAGGSPSVARAILAAVVFLAALMLDHRGAALNVVAIAACAAVAVAPATVTDAGFLLSFGATSAIIVGARRLAAASPLSPFAIRRVVLRYLLTPVTAVVAATICAEVALAPIAATYFSRVTFAGVLLNLAAIPLMAGVQCGSMAVLLCALLSSGWADGIGHVVHWSAYWLVESSRLVDEISWAVRDVSPPVWWLCALYYGSAAIVVWSSRLRRVGFALFGVASLALVGDARVTQRMAVSPRSADVLRVVMLDVGQGDASLAILPGGRAILVDAAGLAGTTFDVGTRVIVPAARALGVRRLHAFVLTHADPDHIGGAEVVTRRFRPASIWEGVPVPPNPSLRRLEALAAANGIPWRRARPGSVERIDGVEVRVLHPSAPDWERQRVRNDDSVVLELRYHDVSILLPGDIGREGEQVVIPRLELGPLVILKAAHHGSATSSTDAFIDAARPAAVIFSAGKNNRFGHPAPVVVDRYTRRGVEMFNTAHDGAVFVETDGHKVEVWGWASGRRFTISARR